MDPIVSIKEREMGENARQDFGDPSGPAFSAGVCPHMYSIMEHLELKNEGRMRYEERDIRRTKRKDYSSYLLASLCLTRTWPP